MKIEINKKFKKYCIFSFFAVLIISFYPLYMGITVIIDMIKNSYVKARDYPKYIIPYTPVSISIILGVALMPLLLKKIKKFGFIIANVVSVLTFFVSELLFENLVIVSGSNGSTQLENWQLFLCIATPEYIFKDWDFVKLLVADYSPAFKLHFYIISLVLIISFLNSFYGFGKMILTGNKERIKHLILQSVLSVLFLLMCIWACFTAFYRTGGIYISPISALLMTLFFLVFGITVGIYVSSFTSNRGFVLSLVLPSVSASIVTLVMYIGEMILLGGKLYKFGNGIFFQSIPVIVFSVFDILVVILSGMITAFFVSFFLMKKQKIH